MQDVLLYENESVAGDSAMKAFTKVADADGEALSYKVHIGNNRHFHNVVDLQSAGMSFTQISKEMKSARKNLVVANMAGSLSSGNTLAYAQLAATIGS